jgi:hypothetical protein
MIRKTHCRVLPGGALRQPGSKPGGNSMDLVSEDDMARTIPEISDREGTFVVT